jgi:predicted enzyme related to lactoylglutathione lyase
MITHVSITSVFVKDVDASKRFYIDVFGFAEKDDITMDGGYRWCTVVHPDHPELMINLTVPGPPLSDELAAAMNKSLDEGGLPGLGMTVDDCQKTFEDFSARGVTFLQEPAKRPYGTEAVCRDNSGNWVVLVEPSAYTPEDFA